MTVYTGLAWKMSISSVLKKSSSAAARIELAKRDVDAGAEVVDLGIHIGDLAAELRKSWPQPICYVPPSPGVPSGSTTHSGPSPASASSMESAMALSASPSDTRCHCLRRVCRRASSDRARDPGVVVFWLQAAPFWQPMRVHVGHARLDGREDPGLLFAHDLAVAWTYTRNGQPPG